MTPLTILWTSVLLLMILVSVSWRIFVYFHDVKGLRRFPNMSLFAGMTNIPFIITAHTGFRSKHLEELHETHPVIRIGPNQLSFSDPNAIKAIYGHGTKTTKDEGYSIAASTHMHLADVVDKADHSRKRKVLSSAYALKNLEEWEHKVADKVERLITQFDRRCTAPLSKDQRVPDSRDLTINYREWTNYFTVDAIADIGLSEKLGFLDQGSDQCTALRTDGTSYTVSFRDSLYGNTRKQSLLVHSYNWYKTFNKLTTYLPYSCYRQGAHASRDWDALVLSRSTKRLQAYLAGVKHDDFFQSLMEDKAGHANNLEWGEINAEVNIMLNAGSTTTAIALANVMYHLLKTPRCLTKLRAEIDAALSPSETIAPYDKVKSLPYLRACLDESLRLYSPTTHNLTRLTPPEGLDIASHFIPGNTSVSMSAHVVHHNETLFPDSYTYNPERWLGDSGKALQPYFLAFSTGARGCIGRNISYLEQTVLIASLLRRYEFALPSPSWEVERTETMNLLVGDMPMKVWRREDVTVTAEKI